MDTSTSDASHQVECKLRWLLTIIAEYVDEVPSWRFLGLVPVEAGVDDVPVPLEAVNIPAGVESWKLLQELLMCRADGVERIGEDERRYFGDWRTRRQRPLLLWRRRLENEKAKAVADPGGGAGGAAASASANAPASADTGGNIAASVGGSWSVDDDIPFRPVPIPIVAIVTPVLGISGVVFRPLTSIQNDDPSATSTVLYVCFWSELIRKLIQRRNAAYLASGIARHPKTGALLLPLPPPDKLPHCFHFFSGTEIAFLLEAIVTEGLGGNPWVKDMRGQTAIDFLDVEVLPGFGVEKGCAKKDYEALVMGRTVLAEMGVEWSERERGRLLEEARLEEVGRKFEEEERAAAEREAERQRKIVEERRGGGRGPPGTGGKVGGGVGEWKKRKKRVCVDG